MCTASPQEFASFLVEFAQIPWEQVKATARQNTEQKEQFIGWIKFMIATDDFLHTLSSESGRKVATKNRPRLARQMADLILAVK